MEDTKNENHGNGDGVYLKYVGLFVLFTVCFPLILLGSYGMDDGWRTMGLLVEGEGMMLTGNVLAIGALLVVLWAEWPLDD
jgi:hypothetical protein